MKLTQIVKVGIASLAIGCGSAEMPTPEVYSPYGIGVILNGYTPDLDKLDRKYMAVVECLGHDSLYAERHKDTFVVKIAGKDDEQGHGFYCGDSSPTGRCNGLYDSETNLIKVNETLAALTHELAHHLTGNGRNCNAENPEQNCRNIPSYWCGDRINTE